MMIPIHTAHVHLRFNKGTPLKDPHKLLHGTGNLIRHIPITKPGNYRTTQVNALVKAAMASAVAGLDTPTKAQGKTISKITRPRTGFFAG